MATSLKTVAFILLLLSLAGAAEKPRAPLPEKLLTAKTVFIDNQSGYSGPLDNCFAELQQWGRFAIAERKPSDIVFRLTSSRRHYTDSTPIIAGNLILDGSHDYSETTLTVLDGESGDVLWSDTRSWNKKHPATTELVKELRGRIDASTRTGSAR